MNFLLIFSCKTWLKNLQNFIRDENISETLSSFALSLVLELVIDYETINVKICAEFSS